MKKQLFFTLATLIPTLSFALNNTINMSDLKCGDLQIYSNTTLKQIKDNCKVKHTAKILHPNDRNLPESYFDADGSLYEVQFYSTSQKGLIRCDLRTGDDNATVTGCRNTY